MDKIFGALLFAGPALAVLLGFLFALASPTSRVFAPRPVRMALALVITMLLTAAGAWRMQKVESDTAVLLTVIGLGVAGCAVGFALAFGVGLLFGAVSQRFSGRGSRSQFRATGVSSLAMKRPRRTTELPPGPRIKQGK